MKKSLLFLGGVLAVMNFASCNQQSTSPDFPVMKGMDQNEIAIANGVNTKGYIDGTTFYDARVDSLHHVDRKGVAREMRVSSFLTPQTGDARNYFVDELFSENAGVWRHNPALYWPLSSRLDFLAYSSTIPFEAKDAIWGEYNATSNLKLNISKSYTQDDVVYAAASMTSDKATTSTYQVAQPVAMEFYHSQAWLEFQLSVATSEMKDKIAIKEIIVENAYNEGTLVLTRNDVAAGQTLKTSDVTANWQLDGKKNFVFDDNYGVYGRSKVASDFSTENQAVKDAEVALKEAKNKGIQAVIDTAEVTLAAAKAALAAKISAYELVNPLNIVGEKSAGGTASPAAEVSDKCAFLDMLLPQQAKTSFIIRYVLAGQPDVLEYRYDLAGSSSNSWVAGHKYIYDIDFVVSEITIAPTVKLYEAEFDASATPVEII